MRNESNVVRHWAGLTGLLFTSCLIVLAWQARYPSEPAADPIGQLVGELDQESSQTFISKEADFLFDQARELRN